VASVTEQLKLIMCRLSPAERRVLEMRLQGITIEEISDQVNRSERTVRRLLSNARREMELRLC
jgi:DNA-binding CsgD family transcriptional regulator